MVDSLDHLPEVDTVVVHIDCFVAPGRKVLADEVRSNGQFAMTTINHHCQLNLSGSTVIGERIERGTDCSSGEQHIVDQHHCECVQIRRDFCDGFGKYGAQPDVIAVEGHINAAHRDFNPFDLSQSRSESTGKRDTPGLQSDEDNIVETMVAFDDLVRHAPGGPLHVFCGHYPGSGNKNASIGRRQSSFAFSQVPQPRAWFLLSVRASQDSLHGQKLMLAHGGGDRRKDPIDETTTVVGGVPRGEINRFGDDSPSRNIGPEGEFVGGEPQQCPVESWHAVKLPVPSVIDDERIDGGTLLRHTGDKLDGELVRFERERRQNGLGTLALHL